MTRATYPTETISKLLDLTPRRVQQLVAEGVIPKAERGRYELVPVVRAYIRYLRDRALAGDVGAEAFAQHRSRLAKARADMAELERAQLLRELVPAKPVEDAWAAIVGVVRTRLLALPTKLAPTLSGLTHEAKIKAVLAAEIAEALNELAEAHIDVEPLRSAAPEADGGDELEGDGAAADADDLAVG